MFVGHAMLAFAVVAAVASAAGSSRRGALALGATAGAFAAVPDVDILYALLGLVRAETSGALAMADAFWETGNVVHRAVTHSLVLAVPASLAAAAWAAGVRRDGRAGYAARGVAVALVAGVVAVAAAESGPLGVVVVAAFGGAVVAVGNEAARRTDASVAAVFTAALFGLWSHPFGDLFTGHPPAFLYPFDATLVAHRVTLHPDPTVHLLAAFGLELLVVWAAVATFVRLTDVHATVTPHAGIGAGYAAAAFVVPAPTLDLSYPFVFTVLAVGFVGGLPRFSLERDAGVSPSVRLPERTTALLTGLTAVTLGWVAYAAVYLVTGGL